MGETTGITWTDSTINVWVGCHKVSPGCKHCYAEVSTPIRVKRAGGLEVWGANAARSETKSWERDLRKWNRQSAWHVEGRRTRVFAQSLSDTFEDREGACLITATGARDTLDTIRARFFGVVERCHALTFQLLTKRPENILRMVPPSWLKAWPAHVWIGTTVEDQERAEERIPHLLRVPARVRFLSVEPQIEAIDLSHWFDLRRASLPFDWIIQGGESGPKARPFDLAWARSMRDQCKAAGVAYFLKQLGARPLMTVDDVIASGWDRGQVSLRDSHGGDESEWPADLRGCRAFPEAHP